MKSNFVSLTAAAIVLCTTGCDHDRPNPADYRTVELAPATITAAVRIDQKRTNASVILTNVNEFDIACSQITVRSVFDNPDTYLETGEHTLSFSNYFLRGKQVVEKSVEIPADPVKVSHIRTVSSLEGGQTCRPATFMDYCRYAPRSREENRFLSRLFYYASTADCETLLARLKPEKHLDFTGWGDITARPLIYLPDVRTIKLDDTQLNTDANQEIRSHMQAPFFDGSP